MRSALEAGVAGYVLFECNRQEVIDSVHDVCVGARYVCATAARRVADSLSHAALAHREIEVLQLLAKGYCNKWIGRRLAIATGTVKAHVKNVLEKLGATNRTHAVALAAERGLTARTRLIEAQRRQALSLVLNSAPVIGAAPLKARLSQVDLTGGGDLSNAGRAHYLNKSR